VKEAIGDRFHAVLVDNGVMRLDECRQVKETLAEHLGINLTIADASQRFLSGLAGELDPEKKRKFIGNTFIDIFEEEAIKIEKAAENTPNAGKVQWFLQGTLYPDVIESISFKGPSATIKVCHGRLASSLRVVLDTDSCLDASQRRWSAKTNDGGPGP
jgi:GMP synthase (glutamine-hydrolysing)